MTLRSKVLRIASRLIAKLALREIQRRNPLKNRAWTLDDKRGYFFTNLSMLDTSNESDPWGRKIPLHAWKIIKKNGTVLCIKGKVRVDGEDVDLMVYNN